MATQRVNRVLVDCPAGTVRLAKVLKKMRERVNKCPRCIRFFKENFGIHPDDLFDSVTGPTIMVDPSLLVLPDRLRPLETDEDSTEFRWFVTGD